MLNPRLIFLATISTTCITFACNEEDEDDDADGDDGDGDGDGDDDDGDDGDDDGDDGDDDGAEAGSSEEGGTSGSALATCADYCATLASNCTGANFGYADEAECNTKCAGFEQGTPGVEEVDTLECRWVHAQEANEDEHCQEAAFMSTNCVEGGPVAPAVCADYCATFASHCTGANSDYADEADCNTKCAGFEQGTPGIEEVDTLECRWIHAQEANEDEHCQEGGFMSTNCL
jgi:hypothetical protein